MIVGRKEKEIYDWLLYLHILNKRKIIIKSDWAKEHQKHANYQTLVVEFQWINR